MNMAPLASRHVVAGGKEEAGLQQLRGVLMQEHGLLFQNKSPKRGGWWLGHDVGRAVARRRVVWPSHLSPSPATCPTSRLSSRPKVLGLQPEETHSKQPPSIHTARFSSHRRHLTIFVAEYIPSQSCKSYPRAGRFTPNAFRSRRWDSPLLAPHTFFECDASRSLSAFHRTPFPAL
jgi:hypothetical protein